MNWMNLGLMVEAMKKSDFFYDLPDKLIAQSPAEKRDESRLMVLDKSRKTVEHRAFKDIVDYLEEGDALVLNNTKVLPARIYGERSTGARVEFLLLKTVRNNVWKCLTKPAKRAKKGDVFTFSKDLHGQIVEEGEEGIRLIEFSNKRNLFEILDEIGAMPLPPYIRYTGDESRYQTVYAKHLGSAAAPTAGLHFTDELMDKLLKKGVKIAYVTLHVGLGTFRSVKVDNIEEHKMHSEYYELDEENATIINSSNRVVAVGTTSVRTLESIYNKFGEIKADADHTDIFIFPGYQFHSVDALITNFHLPESTLLMLVSAFYERKKILNAYNEAIKNEYRFFSFGDAMYIY